MSEYIKREDIRRAALHYTGDELIAKLDELRPVEVPDWIPVTERLPEKSGRYLTFNEHGFAIVYPYSTLHKEWNMCDWMFESAKRELAIRSITHWMPLPQPPEVTK